MGWTNQNPTAKQRGRESKHYHYITFHFRVDALPQVEYDIFISFWLLILVFTNETESSKLKCHEHDGANP